MHKHLLVIARHYAGLGLWHTGDLLDRLLDKCEGHRPSFEHSRLNQRLSLFTMGLFDLSRRVDICKKPTP